MISQRVIETVVGFFILLGLLALLVLAFEVSDLTTYRKNNSYEVIASFDNIGDLKVRAPVTIAGVRVGQVANISLDHLTYKAKVILKINHQDDNIPIDSAASIVTAGLLGANFIAISPGFEESYLKNGDKIEETHSAIQLEQMIGQLLFSMNKDKADS